MDVSLSMAATDVAPSRLKAAQAAAKAFVKDLPRDVRVAIVAFAGDADLVLAPTVERDDAMAAIDNLQLNYNTAIGSGLVAALLTIFPDWDFAAGLDIFGMGRSPVRPRRISRNQPRTIEPENFKTVPAGSNAYSAIVLLTDGRATFGLSPAKAASMAAERGVRVYTVGFGTPEGSSVEIDGEAVEVSLDEAMLKDIAEVTGGAYFNAATAEELRNVYQGLKGRVVIERKQREATALFTALAAVLSIFSASLSLAWSNRLV
jgi:Ca-activated chloride channel family protein